MITLDLPPVLSPEESASDAQWAYAAMNWRFGLEAVGGFEVYAFAVFASREEES